MHILSVGTAHPPHFYDQDQLLAAFERNWNEQHHNPKRVAQFHQAVCVGGRYLALPMEEYPKLNTFGETNDQFIRVGLDVAEQAIHAALDQAALKPADVDCIFFASVTGIATPSLDARLINRVGFRNDIKRYPLFGLGCVAGAAGIARLNDYLVGHKQGVALLVCVELCSLTLQKDDLSVANLIGSGLFGDGAAAVVAVGNEHSRAGSDTTANNNTANNNSKETVFGPKVLETASSFYPNTERVMGWDITENGFKIVLSAEVPDVVRTYLRRDVDSFLATHKQSIEDITSWVCHPGGPKVLEAFEEVLGLDRSDLSITWDSLQRVGNMSSASVLFILADTIKQRRPNAGDKGLMLAMGPGFCSELILLEW